ncbi:Ig-like domain-containing protein [Nonomuraea antimicrobica]
MALRRFLIALMLAVTGLAIPAPVAAGAALSAGAADASIAAPAVDSLRPAGPLLLRGAASGAARVRVAVQDRVSRLWLRPDGSFGDYHAFPASLDGTAWSHTWSQAVPGEYGVQVTAYDAAGVPDATLPWAPFTVVALPAAGTGAATAAPAAQELLPVRAATTARGLARAGAGVAAVDLAIKNRVTGQWWRADGTWGAHQWHRTRLATPGGPLTEWSFAWTPPQAGEFATQVRTTSADGGTAPAAEWPFTAFTVDAAEPDAVMDPAQAGALPVGRPAEWRGRASDAVGVAAVYVAVQDRASKQWWRADGTWGAYQRHAATLTGPPGDETWSVRDGAPAFTVTGWSYSWTPPRAGDFGMQVTAVDAADQPDLSPSWAPFTAAGGGADTVRPAVEITSPRDGDVLTAGPVRLAGTATDDAAVTAIYVGVMDTATGRWWQQPGGWGTAPRLTPRSPGWARGTRRGRTCCRSRRAASTSCTSRRSTRPATGPRSAGACRTCASATSRGRSAWRR